MQKALFYPCFLLLSWSLVACQKEIAQSSNDYSLKKLAITESDSITYYSYKYDSQNRLVTISASNNQGQGERHRIDLSYDASGRLSMATDTFMGGTKTVHAFQYDINDRIIDKQETTSLTTPYLKRNTYAYDTKGRLIADTTYSYWSNDIFEYITYTYDASDNITEEKTFRKSATGFQLDQSMQMQYDNQPNPFYSSRNQLYYLLSYVYGAEQCLSRNNAVKVSYSSGAIVTNTYQYSASGFAQRYVSVDNTDPLEITCDFFY